MFFVWFRGEIVGYSFKSIVMSKNILVTGLVLGKETDMCSCDNINTGWLFNRPTDLLWADKIIITQNEWNVVASRDTDAVEKAVKLFFETLKAEGLIQIIPDSIISQSRSESILKNLESDLLLIEDLYTIPDKENDPIMRMGQYHFCVPSLWTLYAAIEISREYNASFSLEHDELAYLSALIPRKYDKEIKAGRNIAMDEVLSLFLPSVKLGHDFLWSSTRKTKSCQECSHMKNCSDSYLSIIEGQMEYLLKLRQLDEIRMTCETMDRICERSIEKGVVLSGDELWDDIQEEADKVGAITRKKLKKVNTWKKVSTYVSIGLSASSFLNPIIGATAAIPAIAGQVLSSVEDNMKKETSWVNFVNNPEDFLRDKAL